jgi:hypothetical protein
MTASYGKKNTTSLIDSIKKRASVPISQNTFQPEDILNFANEEMDNVLIPTILRCKEEYYVITEKFDIPNNEEEFKRVPIPYRAVGGRIRHVYLENLAGGRRNLTRIQPEDVGMHYLGNVGSGDKASFFLEGDDIVLVAPSQFNDTDKLGISYYLAPNDLVIEARVPSITTIENSALIEEQLITFGGVPDAGTFIIGYGSDNTAPISYTASASNIQTAIRALNSKLSQVVVSGSFNSGFLVTFNGAQGDILILNTSANTLSVLSVPINITVTETVRGANITDIYLTSLPDHFQIGEMVDFIENESSHRILGFDIPILDVNDDVGGQVRITILSDFLPRELKVNDHVAIAGETKVPQIPSDMHSMLAQATACRILEAQGETSLLERAEKTLARMLENSMALIDNRSESTPQKIVNQGGFLKRRRSIF